MIASVPMSFAMGFGSGMGGDMLSIFWIARCLRMNSFEPDTADNHFPNRLGAGEVSKHIYPFN